MKEKEKVKEKGRIKMEVKAKEEKEMALAPKGEGKETKEDVSIYDPSLIGGDGKDEYVPGKRTNGNVQN